MPQDISIRGHLVDEQYSYAMREAGFGHLSAGIAAILKCWRLEDAPRPGPSFW
jgi:hypothetical protein